MKKLIYILEDEAIMRGILTRLLSENFVVDSFPTIRAFMDTLTIQRPDIYLLDIDLPDGNGLDVAKFIVNSKYEQRPILIMSANKKALIAEKMQSLYGFIEKPFSFEELKQKINTVMLPK